MCAALFYTIQNTYNHDSVIFQDTILSYINRYYWYILIQHFKLKQNARFPKICMFSSTPLWRIISWSPSLKCIRSHHFQVVHYWYMYRCSINKLINEWHNIMSCQYYMKTWELGLYIKKKLNNVLLIPDNCEHCHNLLDIAGT